MIFCRGLKNPESPVALADGSWLCVEGASDRGCVTRISADGAHLKVVVATGRPNGLAVDAAGNIWVAESKVPSLLRVAPDGSVEVIATGCDGEAFLFPNDLCLGPDGALYMTDSGVHIDTFAPGGNIREDYRSVSYDGRVYRIDVSSGEVRKIDSRLEFANGIAFGPDDHLYVNETLTGMIYRYAWHADGVIGARTAFGNVIDPAAAAGWKGPDGMAFGADGNLYVAVFAQRDVTILGRNGAVVNRLRTAGRLPTNCAFALHGQRKLYVTEYELGQIEVFDVGIDGAPLHL